MHSKETAEIEGNPMEILVFEPEGEGRFPGIVVAQHLPIAHAGLEKDPFTIDVGERLAGAGYACVIPFIFHWWPPEEDVAVKREKFRDDWVVADMAAAYARLAAREGVDESRIGIIGHCWGGRSNIAVNEVKIVHCFENLNISFGPICVTVSGQKPTKSRTAYPKWGFLR